MKRIHFAHLSDTHLNRSGKEGFLKTDTTKKLHKVFECIQKLPDKMDFVIITGDIAHEGDMEDYRYVKELFEGYEQKLGIPILFTLGNHDNRKAFYAGFLGMDSEESYVKSTTIDGLRVLLLDSKVGAHGINGYLGPDQLDWLRREVDTPSPNGTLIAFHHPPEGTVLPMGEHSLTNSSELKAMIQNSDVIGVLTGHTHFPSQSMYGNGILSSTAGSTAYGLQMTDEFIQFVDVSSFNICSVASRQLCVGSFQDNEAAVLATFSRADLTPSMLEEFIPENLKTKVL